MSITRKEFTNVEKTFEVTSGNPLERNFLGNVKISSFKDAFKSFLNYVLFVPYVPTCLRAFVS